MDVPLKVSGVRPRISVILTSNTEDTLKKFRCNVCGKVVFEYYSHIRMILPGLSPFSSAPIVVQCNGVLTLESEDGRYKEVRCGTKYWIE